MITTLRLIGLSLGLTFFTSSALAIDCARAVTVVENTLCSVPQLVWLDSVLNDSYRARLQDNPQHLDKKVGEWRQLRDGCTSTNCLRSAYFKGISELFDADRPFDWKGEWWNSTAINGNGGHIIINRSAEWGFRMDATLWGGVYKANFSGDASKFYGLGFVNNIAWGGKCTILMMPRLDGKIDVSSDSSGSCGLLMPGGIAIDGTYVRADKDPRPAQTLLSLGIFPDKALDDRFHTLVGAEYINYVQTANNVLYGQDLDNIGASVLNLSVKGQANRKSAIIMYTPNGKIWAMRVQPDANQRVKISYTTTEQQNKSLPKTLEAWRTLFVNE
ncbi:lysozyme inhibitor LprI family protein [Erwinia sp.]|uniref:lysozyme inhibitor LprI family protein n=1 Tax=Erwinia citreus TaxID=558 RepID=UPI003C73C388